MTGISMYNITDMDDPALSWSSEVNVEEFYSKIVPRIESIASGPDELEIVMENFIISVATAKKTAAPWSLQLIGLVQYLCWKHKIKLTLQKPGDREFMTKEKIKRLGFWHKGGAGHAVVSMQHAGVYLINKNGKLAKRLIV